MRNTRGLRTPALDRAYPSIPIIPRMARFSRPQTARLNQTLMLPEELAAIKSAAKQAGISVSEFVRQKLLADLQPILSQSPPIPEALQNRNQPLQVKSNGIENDAARQIDNDVSRKTSHAVGCDCVVCARYRRMFGG
jgi:mobilization protein NikA